VSRPERPLAAVPGWLWALLGASLAAQIGLHASLSAPSVAAADLPAPPRAGALRAMSLGEPAAVSRLSMLYVQTFDSASGNRMPYQRLDYSRLAGWLRAILETDPRSGYPLFAAAHVYAEVEDPARARLMYEFVHQAFLEDPNRRWPWMAHIALLAKHRLKNLPLARRYAADIQRLTTTRDVPLWATQMEAFILEDMGELEAARVMLGGLLASGRLQDPAERKVLKERLEALEARKASGQ